MKNKKNFIGILTGIGVIIPALSLAASCGSKTTAKKETKTKEEQTLENTLMNLNYTNKSESEFTAIEQASTDLNEKTLKNLGFTLPKDFPMEISGKDVEIKVTKAKNSKVVKYEYTIGKLKGSVEVTFKFFRTKEMDDFLKTLENYNESAEVEAGFKSVYVENQDAFKNSASLNQIKIKSLSTLKSEVEKFKGKILQLQLNKKSNSSDLTYVVVYSYVESKTVYLEKTVTFTKFLPNEFKKAADKLSKLKKTDKTRNEFLGLAKTDIQVIESSQSGSTISGGAPHSELGIAADTKALPSTTDLGGGNTVSLTLSKSANSAVLEWKMHYDDGKGNTKDYTLEVEVISFPYAATYEKALKLDWTKATEVVLNDSPTENLGWKGITTVVKVQVTKTDGGEVYYLWNYDENKIYPKKAIFKNLAENADPAYVGIATKEVTELLIFDEKGKTEAEVSGAEYDDYKTHVEYIKYLQPWD